jgi:hypothetical protein
MLRTRQSLVLENLALRHQLAVLQRTAPRPRFRTCDRLLWVLLARLWHGWAEAVLLVKPETVIRWHRTGFKLFWTWKSRRSGPGRPSVSPEVRALIRRMSRARPTCVGCCETTVPTTTASGRTSPWTRTPRNRERCTVTTWAESLRRPLSAVSIIATAGWRRKDLASRWVYRPRCRRRPVGSPRCQEFSSPPAGAVGPKMGAEPVSSLPFSASAAWCTRPANRPRSLHEHPEGLNGRDTPVDRPGCGTGPMLSRSPAGRPASAVASDRARGQTAARARKSTLRPPRGLQPAGAQSVDHAGTTSGRHAFVTQEPPFPRYRIRRRGLETGGSREIAR